MAFNKTAFANNLALRLIDPADTGLFDAGPPAEPDGPPTPAEVVIVDRPKFRYRMEVFRNAEGFIDYCDLVPVARVTHELPEE